MGTADEERKRRLAQALRDNLRRRKAQDRARKAPAPAAPPPSSAPGQDDSSEPT